MGCKAIGSICVRGLLGTLMLALPAAAESAPLAAAQASPVHGDWQAPGGVLIRVGPCGYDTARVCGQIVGAADPALAGRTVFTDLQASGTGRWSGGQVWVWGTDRIYAARLLLSGDRLSVQACEALACRGETWARVQATGMPPAVPAPAAVPASETTPEPEGWTGATPTDLPPAPQ